MNKTQREKMSQGKLMLLGIAREMRIARKSHCKRLQGEIVLQENARENNVANNHQKKNDAARESQVKNTIGKDLQGENSITRNCEAYRRNNSITKNGKNEMMSQGIIREL
jgi:hypothetical protein